MRAKWSKNIALFIYQRRETTDWNKLGREEIVVQFVIGQLVHRLVSGNKLLEYALVLMTTRCAPVLVVARESHSRKAAGPENLNDAADQATVALRRKIRLEAHVREFGLWCYVNRKLVLLK